MENAPPPAGVGASPGGLAKPQLPEHLHVSEEASATQKAAMAVGGGIRPDGVATSLAHAIAAPLVGAVGVVGAPVKREPLTEGFLELMQYFGTNTNAGVLCLEDCGDHIDWCALDEGAVVARAR